MLSNSNYTASIVAQIRHGIKDDERNLLKYTQLFKLANLGNMLSGTLHTFNNILGGILGYSQLLKDEQLYNADVNRQASIIENAAKRASKLISQLQYFSQRDSYRRAPVDPKVIVKEVVTILESALPKNITLTSEFNHGRARINVDFSAICHVLLNLAFNASDAMPDGGVLSFSVGLEEFSENYKLHKSSRHMYIRVQDTGHGISKKNLPHIFEPFFTTKNPHCVPGMGLAITRGIVEDQDGTIDFTTEIGEGTVFVIKLPTTATTRFQPVIKSGAEPTTACPGYGEIIMVVDDEAELREMTQQILEKKGYRVLVADSGQNAIEMFKEQANQIQLVILDMIMPGVDGVEVYRNLKQIRKNLKIILTSGYLNNPPFQHIIDRREDTFIQKPWDLTELLQHTQRVLASD